MQITFSKVFQSVNKQDYALPVLQENIEMVTYTVICFLLPFVLGHPQLLVGSVVNCVLVLAALNIRGWKLVPIIMFPSIGVLSAGVLFGTASIALLYLMPFIWLGNAILVFGIKELQLHRKFNPALSLLAAAVAKTVFLFLSAFVLVSFGAIPALFLASMGMLQLQTALIGGVGAFVLQMIKKRFILLWRN